MKSRRPAATPVSLKMIPQLKTGGNPCKDSGFNPRAAFMDGSWQHPSKRTSGHGKDGKWENQCLITKPPASPECSSSPADRITANRWRPSDPAAGSSSARCGTESGRTGFIVADTVPPRTDAPAGRDLCPTGKYRFYCSLRTVRDL